MNSNLKVLKHQKTSVVSTNPAPGTSKNDEIRQNDSRKRKADHPPRPFSLPIKHRKVGDPCNQGEQFAISADPCPVDSNSHCLTGRRIEVFRRLKEEWHIGNVISYDGSNKMHLLVYEEDKNEEWVSLERDKVRLLDTSTTDSKPPTKNFNKNEQRATEESKREHRVEKSNSAIEASNTTLVTYRRKRTHANVLKYDDSEDDVVNKTGSNGGVSPGVISQQVRQSGLSELQHKGGGVNSNLSNGVVLEHTDIHSGGDQGFDGTHKSEKKSKPVIRFTYHRKRFRKSIPLCFGRNEVGKSDYHSMLQQGPVNAHPQDNAAKTMTTIEVALEIVSLEKLLIVDEALTIHLSLLNLKHLFSWQCAKPAMQLCKRVNLDLVKSQNLEDLWLVLESILQFFSASDQEISFSHSAMEQFGVGILNSSKSGKLMSLWRDLKPVTTLSDIQMLITVVYNMLSVRQLHCRESFWEVLSKSAEHGVSVVGNGSNLHVAGAKEHDLCMTSKEQHFSSVNSGGSAVNDGGLALVPAEGFSNYAQDTDLMNGLQQSTENKDVTCPLAFLDHNENACDASEIVPSLQTSYASSPSFSSSLYNSLPLMPSRIIPSESLECPGIPVTPESNQTNGLLRNDNSVASGSRSSIAHGRSTRKYRQEKVNMSQKLSERVEEFSKPGSCFTNILIVKDDKGWRETGAEVTLKSLDTNQWALCVKLHGSTKFTYMPQDAKFPKTREETITRIHGQVQNRSNCCISVWKGGEDWSLEFSNRSQWLLFKKLYQKCYERNCQSSALKHKDIPLPGVYIIDNVNIINISIVPFVYPPHYIKEVEHEVTKAMSSTSVIYDMDSNDEQWLCQLNKNGSDKVSDESFEKIISELEKISFERPSVLTIDDAVQMPSDFVPVEALRNIYSYWEEKRKNKGTTLVRQYQRRISKQTPPKEVISKTSERKQMPPRAWPGMKFILKNSASKPGNRRAGFQNYYKKSGEKSRDWNTSY